MHATELLIGHPELLSNEIIQNLSVDANNTNSRWLFWKQPNPLLITFKNYGESNTVYAKWIFLVEKYLQLSPDDKLAKNIQTCFSNAFLLPKNYFISLDKMHNNTKRLMLEKWIKDFFVEAKLKPHLANNQPLIKLKLNQLTDEIIQNIGRSYLQRHGSTAKWPYSMWHSNQEIARKLIRCKTKSFKERWRVLTNIYGMLPNNRGELAKEIRGLFKAAFQFEDADLGNLFFSSTASIAEKMRNKVENEHRYFVTFPDMQTNWVDTTLGYTISKVF